MIIHTFLLFSSCSSLEEVFDIILQPTTNIHWKKKEKHFIFFEKRVVDVDFNRKMFILFQLYEIDDNPKRKEFLDDLFTYMQKKGEFLTIYCY